MIITIARECGCDGDKIGEKLAEHFSIPFYNKKKIQKIAEKSDAFGRFPRGNRNGYGQRCDSQHSKESDESSYY